MTQKPALLTIGSSDNISAHVQEVQRIVREKTSLELTDYEIIRIYLLSMEPKVLARSIVFSLTGNALDLAEDGDDEPVGESVKPPAG